MINVLAFVNIPVIGGVGDGGCSATCFCTCVCV